MKPAPFDRWLRPFAAALAADDPRQALADAQHLLAEIGPTLDDDMRGVAAELLRVGKIRVGEHEAHARTRERMEMLSAASFEGIFINVDGEVIDANQRLCEMLGYDHAEILGDQTMRRCVAPEDLPGVVQRLANRIEGDYVITGVRKDGSRFRAELNTKQGKLGDRPVRVVAVRDVTERERTLALLRESERRLQGLAQEAFDVFVVSRDGVAVDVGGPIEDLLGISREQVIGRPLLDLVAPESRPLAAQVLAEQRAGAYETVLLGANGERVPAEIVGSTSTINGEPVRVAGVRDLREAKQREAERRALEQRMEQSQRLESLGVLAGGIAHDFNNLLVGVMGNADVLLESLANPSERGVVEDIRRAAERAAGLTAQMLAYAGKRELGRRHPVDLGPLWRELRSLLDATLSKKARIEVTVAPGSVVLGNEVTLTQVLMNLLVNASDALQDQPGRIDVLVRPESQPGASWSRALGAPVGPGRWILVQVRDTGVGMDEQTLGRIFEPFFSTKRTGRGLGLAACLGIVSAHGGAVLVDSKAGEGTCFSLLLPAAPLDDTPAPEPRQGQPKLRPTPDVGGKVLLVDDEPAVRLFLRRALERHGYIVVEATDGRGALAALESDQPDVVLLDMTMPDMDGAQVIRRVRARGSKVPIVLSSGYVQPEAGRELDPDDLQGYLVKPYGIAQLLAALERARAG